MAVLNALDTNVVVRFLTGDGEEQVERVLSRLEEATPAWVSLTVLLETEWVLRSSYGYSAAEVRGALAGLLGLPNLEVEQRPRVLRALAWGERGLDFADALHLASSPAGSTFVTFDRKVLAEAGKLSAAPPVRTP